jgi:hypothetical protein
MLSITYKALILSVMLSVVMLNAIMLSVVAPQICPAKIFASAKIAFSVLETYMFIEKSILNLLFLV